MLQILDPCHQLNFTVVQYLAVILIDHPLVAQETYSKCDVVVVSFIWHFCSIIQSLIKKKVSLRGLHKFWVVFVSQAHYNIINCFIDNLYGISKH